MNLDNAIRAMLPSQCIELSRLLEVSLEEFWKIGTSIQSYYKNYPKATRPIIEPASGMRLDFMERDVRWEDPDLFIPTFATMMLLISSPQSRGLALHMLLSRPVKDGNIYSALEEIHREGNLKDNLHDIAFNLLSDLEG